MANINSDLVARLQQTLKLRSAATYARIKATSIKYRLPRRDLAALMLAWESGISIQKYADAEQLDRLGRLTGHQSEPTLLSVTPAPAIPSKKRNARSAKPPKTVSNSVFVVHGRDEELRKSMFSFLRALGLNPIEWGHAVDAAKGANPYVGQVIETAMAKVQAVVVLFSPDEEAYLKEQFCTSEDGKDRKPQGQPRPNVLFEAGLALGAHPEKTVLVQIGKVRGFSDIAGKHLVRLTDEVPKRNELANRLAKFGCAVNKVGNDWMTVGTFSPTQLKTRKSNSSSKS